MNSLRRMAALVLFGAAPHLSVQAAETPAHWRASGQQALDVVLAHHGRYSVAAGGARNVILFVGDGMGVTTVTAARIRAGQLLGGDGESHRLSFERLPFTGLAKTYSADAQTADSASTMTALISGFKTDNGVLSLPAGGPRDRCLPEEGAPVSAFEHAKRRGLATGIVTTTRVTHATPAATYARAPERGWEANVSPAAEDCRDIARQLLEWPDRLRRMGAAGEMDVVLGGGRANFEPAPQGARADGLNLLEQWRARHPERPLITSAAELQKALQRPALPLWGLFAPSHMAYEADRKARHAEQPSLADMTAAAIKALSAHPQGYLLVVEGGRIDHAHHAGNAFNALGDTIALASAVEVALEATREEDTLIIVTADHSHVVTLAGYPRRNNPILGLVTPAGAAKPALAADGRPYTTLSYANGLGLRDLKADTDADRGYGKPGPAGRALTPAMDSTAPGFFQEALVPLASETHGGEDVPVYARGPSAPLLTGNYEQTHVFYVIAHALGLLTPPTTAPAKPEDASDDR